MRHRGQIGRIAHDPSGVIVRYRSSANDRRDGRVAGRCIPASGSRFHPGMPGSVPPLLCSPDEPCDATREYAAWRFDR
jgi:hypothetical protein